MKLATYTIGEKEIAGAILDENVVALSPDMKNLLGLTASEIEVKAEGSQQHPLKDVRLKAPVSKPEKVICLALNYREHAKEGGMSDEEIEALRIYPFLKPPSTTVIGPGDNVVLPRGYDEVDWEVELAVVIGKECKYISQDEVFDYIAGYTVLNDISCRELQFRKEGSGPRYDWLGGKGLDTFAPMGPWIVTSDEIDDPHDLKVSLKLNNEVKQSSSTNELIFKIPEIIEYLSSLLTLEVGDVISTGTPSGVGRSTNTYLKPGDVMEAYVEGVGTLRNGVV